MQSGPESAEPSATPDLVRRGMLLAFGAAGGAAIGLIPYKIAVRDAAPEHVVVAMLLAAALFNSISSVGPVARRRAGTDTSKLSLKATLITGVVLGVLAAGANFTASEAVSRLDASVSSVLIQMQVLFAAALAWAWLHERVRRRFVLGAAVAIVGVALMQTGGVGGGLGDGGVLWGLAAAACFGSMQVVTRRFIDRIEPVWVNALRLWIAVLIVAALPGSLAGVLDLPARIVALAAAAAFCGPFLGRLMMMMSARYVPAATSTLIGLSAPLIALFADWLILDGFPDTRQWIGGCVIGLGMIVAIAPTRLRRTAVVSIE
jgi:drug/metabolite transporter (DMT)-like permease